MQGFGALMPASADLHTREDFRKLSNVFASAMRILAVFSLFMFTFLAVNGDLIVRGYVGPEKYDPRTVFALMFLCASSFTHILTGPGTSMLRGAGKPGFEMTYQLCAIAIFLVLFRTAQYYQHEVMIIFLAVLLEFHNLHL